MCNGEKDCPDGRDEDRSICSKSLSGSSYFLSRKNTYDLVVKSLRHSHEKLPTKTTGFSVKQEILLMQTVNKVRLFDCHL